MFSSQASSVIQNQLCGMAFVRRPVTAHLRLLATLTTLWSGFFAANAQIGGTPTGVSPTIDTDVSSLIATGCGYDAWTGVARRTVVDFEVAGAVSEHGLRWERTYNSSSGGWSFAYTWQLTYRPYFNNIHATYPDGRDSHFEAGTKERYFQDPVSADLYLDDGSAVHFDRWVDDVGTDGHPVLVDHYTPLYLTDRCGRQTLLTWEEWDTAHPDSHNIRLKQVTDPSGRWINIYYDPNFPLLPTRVEGSDGHWVTYIWSAGLTHVTYSDGTSADYVNGTTTWGLNANNTAGVMLSAKDTRASGPMQNISYEYNTHGRFQGQIQAEHYLNADGSPGVAVSTFTSNSDNTTTVAIQSETRGDAPVSRSIKMNKLNGGQGAPFVTYKTDYNGVQEKYAYNANFFLNKITDRRNNDTTFNVESVVGNITRKTHPDLTHTDYTYTHSFYPYYIGTVIDENGKTTTYHRNDATPGTLNRGMINSIDYPTDVNTPAAHEYFYYNSFGEVIAHKLSNDAYQYFLYDSGGLLTDATNPTWTDYATYRTTPISANFPFSEPHTHYAYYGPGHAWQDRIQTVTDPNGNAITSEYDHLADANGQISSTTGAACPGRGLVTKITTCDGSKLFTYDKYGNKIAETDEMNHTITHHYDDYMRMDWTKNALGNMITFDYTATNGSSSFSHTTKNVRWTISPQACGTPGIKTGQTFDNNLRLLTKTLADGSAIAATTTFGYDPNGNLTSVQDPRGYITTTIYDTRNRKTQVTDPGPLSYFTKWFYDNASNVTSIQRKDGTTETKTYDAMNRVLVDTVPKDVGPPATYITTTFNHNASGTLNWVKDGNGNYTYFTYDNTSPWGAAGLKTKMTYQNGDHRDFGYDNNHNLLWRQIATPTASPVPTPVYQVFEYDCRNRKKSMSWHYDKDAHSTDVPWANGAEHDSYVYDAAGRMTQASNIFSTVNRTYWDNNLLKSDQQILATGIDKTVNYEYDAASENTRMHVDDGNGYDRDFCYDEMGRFKTIKEHATGATWFTYTYDAASNVMTRACSLNGVTQSVPTGTSGYDVINRLLEKDQKLGATTFAYEKYGYDSMSRMLTVDREDLKRDTLGYNLNGEMTSALYQWQSNRNVGYTLDYAGNRTNVTDTLNGNKSYAADPAGINRYTTVGADSVTNTLQHQIGAYQNITYAYMGDSYVAAINGNGTSYSVCYDALGRCVKRTINGVTTYYVSDGEKPILEYTSTGAIAGKNVYGKGIDEILMRTDPLVNSGQPFYYQDDHEGSVTHLTNASGAVIETYRYDAFGKPTINGNSSITSSPLGNRFMFTGREYISQFGIYEYRARTYHPGLGRFMSEDPKGFDAGDYNLFRYCHNDPEDLTDPMGLSPSAYPGMNGMPGPDPTITATANRMVTGSNIPVPVSTTGTVDSKGNYHPTQITVGQVSLMGSDRRPNVPVRGGTYEQRKYYRQITKEVFASDRGHDYIEKVRERGYSVTVHLTNEYDAYADSAPSKHVRVDPRYHPVVQTTAGPLALTDRQIIGHEFGHAVMGTKDDGPRNMNNVRLNENPIRAFYHEPLRTEY
jgi:RHS repeat-associated protein